MRLSRSTCFFLAIVMLTGMAIFGIPTVLYPEESLIAASGIIGTFWCLWEGCQSRRKTSNTLAVIKTEEGMNRRSLFYVSSLITAVVILWFAMHWQRVSHPTLFADDHDYIRASLNWSTTWDHLFVPYNEHLCPFARIMTFVIVQLVPEKLRAAGLVVSGMALFLCVLPLVFQFVRKELGSQQAGVIAVMLYAITPVHREVIDWYSASLWIMSLHLLLISLILLQPVRSESGKWRILVVAVIASIAPLTFALGWLVGPMCSAYLFIYRGDRAYPERDASHSHFQWKEWLTILAPLIGSLIAATIIGPMLVDNVVEDSNYGGKSFSEAIHPIDASQYAAQWIVDLLVLRNLDIQFTNRIQWQWTLTIFWLVILVIQFLLRQTRVCRATMIGFLLIALPYGFILPFRAWVPYPVILDWTRYQLWPQLGWSLLLCSIWCDRKGDVPEQLTGLQAVGCAFLLLLLSILHVF